MTSLNATERANTLFLPFDLKYALNTHEGRVDAESKLDEARFIAAATRAKVRGGQAAPTSDTRTDGKRTHNDSNIRIQDVQQIDACKECGLFSIIRSLHACL